MNRLIYNGKTYDDVAESGDKLMSASAYIGDSISAVSLPVDTLTAVIQDYGMYLQLMATEGQPLAADSQLVTAYASETGLAKRSEYGQTVEYYHNDALFAKFYLESIKRVGKYAYQLSCVSAVGLLLTDRHYGGIYTGQTAEEVIADIVGGIFPYWLDEELGDTQIYGWLPIATRRDALRDVLFAIGGKVSKDTGGNVVISPQVSTEPYAITADEFYMGGSVTGGNQSTGVDVTEHSYSALDTDETVTLFDGEAAVSEIVTPKGATVLGALVEFSEPIHDLEVINGVILESGANYAVLAQAPSALLTGKRYTHTTRIISRRKDGSGVPNVATSKACDLVNLMNSELVADRLMAYYGAAKTVEADIVVTKQKPGDAVTFIDPFGDAADGFIADMELTMSSIIKARATLVSGYIPTASGNYYSRVMTVSNSGTVIIPAECKGKIRVVLIGGGHGGLLGTAGTRGDTATASAYGAAGTPGQPGAPGPGGRVFIKTIRANPGDAFEVVIGSGGKGATLTADAEDGTPTTFGELSSADGFPSAVGYMDLVNGTVYGLPGEKGIPGGSAQSWDRTGGILPGDTVEYKGVTYVAGSKGGDSEDGSYYGFGGLGGGAAAGANGKDGGSGSVDDNAGNPFASGGDGGGGATPVKAENGKTPGQGGQGGHGGGAGGGGGPAKGSSSSYTWQGQGVSGGDPGEAGDGADGILLIFY